MADEDLDPDDERSSEWQPPGRREGSARGLLRILGIAVATVAVLCLLAVVGFFVFVSLAMSSYASNK